MSPMITRLQKLYSKKTTINTRIIVACFIIIVLITLEAML